MRKIVKVWQVGRINYAKGLQLQNSIAELHKKSGNNDTLLICEHPPVYTTGIRTKEYGVEEEEKLKKTGAQFFRTNRGGLITYHGPGQMMAYPIINLKNYKASMRWYVCQIEKTIIHLCNQFGLKAETSPHTGVWIGDNKVCAIGIHGSRFVTTHGLALNVCTDLNWFKHIVPCGIEGKGVTSLDKELRRPVTLNEVIPMFLHSFTEVFGCSYSIYPSFQREMIMAQCNI